MLILFDLRWDCWRIYVRFAISTCVLQSARMSVHPDLSPLCLWISSPLGILHLGLYGSHVG